MNYERASATDAGGRQTDEKGGQAGGGRRKKAGRRGLPLRESLLNFLLLLFIDFVRMHNQQTLPSRVQLDPSH